MELSVIIFCYNEEQNISAVLKNTILFLSRAQYKNSEIIVINDGSTDKTGAIAESFTAKFPSYAVRHIYPNQGIGNALNTGYNLASKEFVCAIPGDGQFDIFEIDQINKIRENQFVTFYRKEKNYNTYRSFLTNFNQWFNRKFLKIDVPDINWIKIYRREQIDKKYRVLNSSLVESEICGKLIKSGYTHKDYPSKYQVREYGEAKGGNIKTLIQAVSEILLLYRIIRKFPD